MRKMGAMMGSNQKEGAAAPIIDRRAFRQIVLIRMRESDNPPFIVDIRGPSSHFAPQLAFR